MSEALHTTASRYFQYPADIQLLQIPPRYKLSTNAHIVSSDHSFVFTASVGVTIAGMDELADKYIERQFDHLSQKWKHETGGMSSISQKVLNIHYQRIIRLGKPAIPFIIKALARKPDHWLHALKVLVDEKENPVTLEDANSFEKTRTAWIEYGRRKGYL